MNARNVLVSAAVVLAACISSVGCAAATDADPSAANGASDSSVATTSQAMTATHDAGPNDLVSQPPHKGVHVGTDDFHNCTDASNGVLDCLPIRSGSPADLINDRVFSWNTFSKDQTATLVNTGTVPYMAYVEQGLGYSTPVRVDPGASQKVTAIDDGFFSWPFYTLIVTDVDWQQNLSWTAARGRVEIASFSPPHTACNDDCTTRFEGCLQGCGMNEHGNGMCEIGCEATDNMCLGDCARAGN